MGEARAEGLRARPPHMCNPSSSPTLPACPHPADVALHQVFKFSPAGEQLLVMGEAGRQGSDAAHFCKPTQVAVARSGDIYVAGARCLEAGRAAGPPGAAVRRRDDQWWAPAGSPASSCTRPAWMLTCAPLLPRPLQTATATAAWRGSTATAPGSRTLCCPSTWTRWRCRTGEPPALVYFFYLMLGKGSRPRPAANRAERSTRCQRLEPEPVPSPSRPPPSLPAACWCTSACARCLWPTGRAAGSTFST